MIKTKLLGMAFVMFASLALTPQSGPVDTLISDIVSANTAFGFKAYKELLNQEGESNVFLSPLSLSTALAMCYNGAAGETERAMAAALELQGMDLDQVNNANAMLMESLLSHDKDIRLNLANSLWADVDVKFLESFLAANKEYYDAEITNLELSDPASIDRINQWIKMETQGTIPGVINRSDLDAILFIINAVYFKGMWTVGFHREDTKERDFRLLDGSTKKIPMMMSQSERYSFYNGDGFQAVRLPYGSERVSMCLFLPDEDSSLQDFRKKLSRENWESWMTGFRKEMVNVFLPRLRLDYEIRLNDVLKALGMEIAFSPRADFSKMCSDGMAAIDYVKHASYVDVNEEGTEASAVTVVKMKKGGHHVLTFDRPFFLSIRDDVTGAILFLGSVLEP